MARLIQRLLNDAVLGFLALASLFLMFAPSVFSFSTAGLSWLLITEYAILALFALEYGCGLVLANEKRKYLLNRWRIIDLLIVVLALAALLPVTPDVLRNSPALRLLRLGRLALLGTRSGLAINASSGMAIASETLASAEFAAVALGSSGKQFESITLDVALERIRSAEPDWLFISGVTEAHMTSIAEALGVHEKAVAALFKSSIPRFDRLERFSTLFVRYPLPPTADGRLRRTPVLLIGTMENIVVLSREKTDLEQRVAQRLAGMDESAPRMIRAMVALIGEIVRAYSDVLEQLEHNLATIDSGQAAMRDELFLLRTFDLRADILRVRASLKHLKSVMRDLSKGHIVIAGADGVERELFHLLADDATDLFDGIEDLRDELQGLVDLRLNVSSFQMNRVMRLLALLTALALIPATAGGLLGMNLTDTPWPGTLAQVSFGVAAGMALSLYIFAIKGWLR